MVAILAAITIVAYNGVRTRAQASAIASDIKMIEKSFNLYKTAVGAPKWPLDGDAQWNGATSGDPTIASIITYNAEFRNYTQHAPTTSGLNAGASVWMYDNDNDIYDGCSASGTGVNIKLQNTSSVSVIAELDRQIDDGNTACGKLRMSGNTILYALALTS